MTEGFPEHVVSQNAPSLWVAPRDRRVTRSRSSGPFPRSRRLPPSGRRRWPVAGPRGRKRIFGPAPRLGIPGPSSSHARLLSRRSGFRRVSRPLHVPTADPGPHFGKRGFGPPRLRAGTQLGGNSGGRGPGSLARAEVARREARDPCDGIWSGGAGSVRGEAEESGNPGGTGERAEVPPETPGAWQGRSGRGRGGGEGPGGAGLGLRAHSPRPGGARGGEWRGGKWDPWSFRSRDRPLPLQGRRRVATTARAAAAV